jgi:hypothetical protein
MKETVEYNQIKSKNTDNFAPGVNETKNYAHEIPIPVANPKDILSSEKLDNLESKDVTIRTISPLNPN